MPRPSPSLTPLELEIMKVLWEIESGAVQDVQARLPGSPAYTTVQTMLNILDRKGKLTRRRKGRAFVYKPKVSRIATASHAVTDLIDRMFGGSAEALVMGLVESKKLTPEKLRELQRKLPKPEVPQ